jgi:hypothetical protein
MAGTVLRQRTKVYTYDSELDDIESKKTTRLITIMCSSFEIFLNIASEEL